MTLAVFQETLKTLLMSGTGEAALQSEEAYARFVRSSGLDEKEQALFLEQSMARLRQYEYMVFANTEETLGTIYPITRKLIGEDWTSEVRALLQRYPNQRYHIMGAGEMLPEYLLTHPDWRNRYPFLPELALYEWLEADVLSRPDPELPAGFQDSVPQTATELEHMIPVLNSTAELVVFRYPLPAIVDALKKLRWGEENVPGFAMKPTAICVYRKRKPHACHFFELNPLLAAWVGSAQETSGSTYAEHLEPIWTEITTLNPAVVREIFDYQFLGILSQLRDADILLGSCPKK